MSWIKSLMGSTDKAKTEIKPSTDKPKPEVKTCVLYIANPTARDPHGRVSHGAYICVDGLITLTNRAGDPVRDDHGKTYTHKLEAGENEETMAAVLTKRFRNAIRGLSGRRADFYKPINYGPQKWIV